MKAHSLKDSFVGLVIVAVLSGISLPTFGGLSARSYVMDGLIGQWDGVQNVGYDLQHDSTATKWSDLTGNSTAAFPLSAWAAANWASFGANGLVVTQAKGAAAGQKAGYEIPLFTTAFSNAFYTCEIAYNKTAATTRSANNVKKVKVGDVEVEYLKTVMLDPGRTGGFSFGVKDWLDANGSITNSQAGFSFNGANGRDSGTANILEVATISGATGAHTFSCAQSNMYVRVIADSTSKRERNVYASEKPRTTPDLAGVRMNRTYYTDIGMTGYYHSIRMYDRMLTEQEVYLNSAIDGIRFCGKSLSDYDQTKFPANYSLEMVEGDVILKTLIFIGCAEGEGTFLINDAAATSVWTERGDAVSEHTIKVIPAKGYEFAYWSKGVVGADVNVSEGTIHFTGHEDAVAVFRKTVYDGITDGLVYDLNMSLAGTAYNSLANSGTGGRETAVIGAAYEGPAEHVPTAPSFVRVQPKVPQTDIAQHPDSKAWTTALNLPQPMYLNDSNNPMTIRQAAHLSDDCIDGESTVHIRFRWDGPVYSAKGTSRGVLFANGWNAADDMGWKFGVYGGTAASGRDHFSISFGKRDVDHGGGIDEGQVRTSDLNINTNTWYDMIVAVRRVGGGRVAYDVWMSKDQYVGGGLYRPGLITFSGTITNDFISKISTHRYLAAGAPFEAGGGDSNWQESSGTATSALRNGFRGQIAELQVWNRLLTDEEKYAAFSESWATDRWRIGAKNDSADEFAAAADAETTFDSLTMAWRQFPRELTAAKPSVTIRTPLDTGYVRDANEVKYLVVEPAAEVPAGVALQVSVNGQNRGTIEFNGSNAGMLGLRANWMTPDADGNVSIKLTRTGSAEGAIVFDRVLLRGGLFLGSDNCLTDIFGSNQSAYGQFTVGDTNLTHFLRGPTVTNIYPYVALALDIPEAMTNISFTFRGRVASNIPLVQASSNHPMPFNVYANDELVYTAADGLPGQTWFEIPIAARLLRPGLNVLKIKTTATKQYMKEKYDIDMKDQGYILITQYEVKYEKPVTPPRGMYIIFQ